MSQKHVKSQRGGEREQRHDVMEETTEMRRLKEDGHEASQLDSELHTHFGGFDLLLTLQSFILYVCHPEPQVGNFLVQTLGRRTEPPLLIKYRGGGLCGRETSELFC